MMKKSAKIFIEINCQQTVLNWQKLLSQVFLEECKYIVKEKKMSKYITDNLEISSD